MADKGDLIDFSVIETCKENIQSIPGGRSAKQLSTVLSPLAAKKSPPLSEIQGSKETKRQEFEQELLTIAEADDPLDVYDRYVKWTMDAYTSAQGTNESNLLPLLERATKAFLTSSLYKNDPRYLKLWLLYIRLFSDSPRETYAFLAKHNIGQGLALFYEEFAAWLENAGRWAQAEEVYLKGIDCEARPQERLIRKFGEFQHRRESKGSAQDGPTSPAMPKVRPALAAKLDPFAAAAEEADPQARDRAASSTSRTSKPGRSKMSIFADGDEPSKPGSSDSNSGWDSIGSLKERRKENTREAKPWVGETLQGGRRAVSGPKMMVFRDQSLGANKNTNNEHSQSELQCSINPKTGRKEYVFANLELVYPSGDAESGYEFCFEELRAMKRGLIDPTGRVIKPKKQTATKTDIEQRPVTPPNTAVSPKNTKVSSSRKLDIFQDTQTSKIPVKIPVFDDSVAQDQPVSTTKVSKKIPVFDENGQPQVETDAAARAVKKKMRKEERANRTRKIEIMEVKAEPQTIQTNLNSPAGPKIKRKKSGEATMTLHTKEAMNEVYDLFNQTLTKVSEEPVEDNQSQVDSSDDDDDDEDDDDYTSAGESTTTGRFSAVTSEAGDETQADFTMATQSNVSVGENTNNSDWSEFSEVKELPEQHGSNVGLEIDDENDVGTQEEVLTPTSPQRLSEDQYEEDPQDIPSLEAQDEPGMARRGFSYRSRQLPFMTPIVEKTESSLGAMTVYAEKEYFNTKTPSRQNNVKNAQAKDCDVWSSPFQANTEENKENIKVPQPEFVKPVKADQQKAQPLAPKDLGKEKPKGPIIKELQCNPIEESIRATILSQVQPPLGTYAGFFDRRGQIAAQGVDIRKYTKAVKNKNDKTLSATTPPVLTLSGSSRRYQVRRELGKGAFAPVYLVDSQPLPASLEQNESTAAARMGEGEFGLRRNEQEAVKMEEPPSAWEFYIIRQAKRRLGVSRPSESIVEAYEMHLYEDECFLIEEYRNQGTLLDLVNAYRAEGGVMDEQLVMFFTIELLRTVEALHAKGLIHGDLKADNILVRLDSSDTEWSSQYHRSGTNGWSDKGIKIIDFGRGIDMKAFKPEVQFIADWKTSEADCAEMREMRPWTYQVDYHGLAGIVHSMLFGKYLETVAERGGTLGAGATKTYRIRESLKRYWQTEIWSDVFSLLLNPLMHLDGEDGRRLPVLQGVKRLRERMEMYLETNCEKGSGLKAGLRRVENMIREKRK
ncbi:uncharacterized protein PV09_03422 [Verruconis gallopava]|uniref:Protein kinase domain-containing protein n=1 Tax=Verruconis gallopava TaxID=253628 RepID=A0A0D2AF15_9PEZI|nr:uncharacterized protein PV09_03422 [Verruconis gallopava]KIW05543.1 hypothetical protein PV09_03422 [Verruconis gallopava]